MIRFPSLLLSSSVVLAALASGCNAELTGDPAAETSSEVRTLSCPTAFAVSFTNVATSAIPTTTLVGGFEFQLSSRDRSSLADIQAKFVTAGTIHVKAELSSAQDGVCRYRQPSSTLFGETIKLYAKGGKDILELTVDVERRPFVDDYRIYAFPASYSPQGFTFGSGEVLLRRRNRDRGWAEPRREGGHRQDRVGVSSEERCRSASSTALRRGHSRR